MSVIKVDGSNFQEAVFGASKPVFVDFSATWCGPCNMYHPVFEQFAAENAEKCVCAEVDIDQCPDLAAQFGVYAVPTTIVIVNGAPVGQMMGALNKVSLERKLEEVL